VQSFKIKFSGVTILQGVEFPIFPIYFAWALQQQRYCAACDILSPGNYFGPNFSNQTVHLNQENCSAFFDFSKSKFVVL